MIELKAPEEIEMHARGERDRRRGARRAARRWSARGHHRRARPLAEELTRKKGARPGVQGLRGRRPRFPASLCISINDEVVHGIPSHARVLREGDIVGLDFGVCYRGLLRRRGGDGAGRRGERRRRAS